MYCVLCIQSGLAHLTIRPYTDHEDASACLSDHWNRMGSYRVPCWTPFFLPDDDLWGVIPYTRHQVKLTIPSYPPVHSTSLVIIANVWLSNVLYTSHVTTMITELRMSFLSSFMLRVLVTAIMSLSTLSMRTKLLVVMVLGADAENPSPDTPVVVPKTSTKSNPNYTMRPFVHS